MKALFTMACLLLLSGFIFSQSELPSTEVSGVEFKVIKCQGERSTNSVRVRFSIQNKEEFPLEGISLSELTFTDSNGNQSQPLGKYYATMFTWQNLNYADIPTGPAVNSKEIIVPRISSKATSFSQITFRMEQHVHKGPLKATVKLDNVPIIWK